MRLAARLICFSTITTVVVSSVVCCLVMLGGEAREQIASIFENPGSLPSLLALGAVIPLPISLPAGIIGGMLALRVLGSGHRLYNFAGWLARGSLWGSLVGFVATFVVMAVGMQVQPTTSSFATRGVGQFALLLSAVGALTGAVIGSLVAAYCWRLERLQASVNQLHVG